MGAGDLTSSKVQLLAGCLAAPPDTSSNLFAAQIRGWDSRNVRPTYVRTLRDLEVVTCGCAWKHQERRISSAAAKHGHMRLNQPSQHWMDDIQESPSYVDKDPLFFASGVEKKGHLGRTGQQVEKRKPLIQLQLHLTVSSNPTTNSKRTIHVLLCSVVFAATSNDATQTELHGIFSACFLPVPRRLERPARTRSVDRGRAGQVQPTWGQILSFFFLLLHITCSWRGGV